MSPGRCVGSCQPRSRTLRLYLPLVVRHSKPVARESLPDLGQDQARADRGGRADRRRLAVVHQRPGEPADAAGAGGHPAVGARRRVPDAGGLGEPLPGRVRPARTPPRWPRRRPPAPLGGLAPGRAPVGALDAGLGRDQLRLQRDRPARALLRPGHHHRHDAELRRDLAQRGRGLSPGADRARRGAPGRGHGLRRHPPAHPAPPRRGCRRAAHPLRRERHGTHAPVVPARAVPLRRPLHPRRLPRVLVRPAERAVEPLGRHGEGGGPPARHAALVHDRAGSSSSASATTPASRPRTVADELEQGRGRGSAAWPTASRRSARVPDARRRQPLAAVLEARGRLHPPPRCPRAGPPRHGSTLDVPPDGLVGERSTRELFEWVVENLLKNALDAMEAEAARHHRRGLPDVRAARARGRPPS